MLWSFKTTAITGIKIKADQKNFLPVFAKLILGMRYLVVFLVRIGCIVAYFSPFLGLMDIMNHYKSETLPLDKKIWQNINNTENQQFHYWNDITDKVESVHVSEIFRSNNKITGEPEIPTTTLYTIISLRTAYLLFAVFYLVYGLFLSLIKCCISSEFYSAKFGAKFQHIVEAVNMPDSYGDWDVDHELDLSGHLKKWKQILMEMLLMVLFQLITNMCLLTPFFITGTVEIYSM